MFGANKVTGQKDFADVGDRLKVTSMFVTLQGEGPHSGKPALFVRLAHCQLQCDFCDTYFDSGDWYSQSDLIKAMHATVVDYFDGNDDLPAWLMRDGKVDLVLVITGGEPSIQANVLELAKYGLEIFTAVQVETNGIIPLDWPAGMTVVVSPKVVNGRAYSSLPIDTMLRADCFKFVIEAPHSNPALELSPNLYSMVPDWALEWKSVTDYGPREVYVSPMNIYARKPEKSGGGIVERSTVDETISFWTPGLLDNERNQANHEYAARYALKHGLRLSLQSHLYASLP